MALPQSSGRAPGGDRLDHRNDGDRHAAAQQEASAPVVVVKAIQVHEHEHIECEEVELLRHGEKRVWDGDLRVAATVRVDRTLAMARAVNAASLWMQMTWRASNRASAANVNPRRLYLLGTLARRGTRLVRDSTVKQACSKMLKHK